MSDPSSIEQNVTVVMVSFHTGSVLLDAIAAVLAEPETRELRVVDNGNPSDTRARLHALAAAEPRLKVLDPGRNLGFASGCNFGAAGAHGAYLAFVNPDCVITPGIFTPLIAEFGHDTECWLVTPRLIGPNGNPERGTPRAILTPWTALVEVLGLWRLAPKHPNFQRLNLYATDAYWKPGRVPAVSGAFMLMPTSKFREIGGFDERYFMHVEDLDLCLAIARRGGAIRYVPNLTVTHHQGSSAAGYAWLEWQKTKSAHHYMRKNFAGIYPGWSLTVVSFFLLLRFAASAVLGERRR